MGRRRRRINEHLPKHVYRKGAGFIYRRDGKDTYLCKQTAPLSELWAAYGRVTQPDDHGTLRWLLDDFMARKEFKSRSTQEAYEGYYRILTEFKTADGTAFGDVRLEMITRRSIRAYLDKYPSPISANRQIQFLKAAWNTCLEFHDLPDNPCMGVTLNKQEARTRYVNQEEYEQFLSTTNGYIPIFMELAYLLRARWGEVANLRAVDLVPEGVVLQRSKGSEGEITAWTPRLEKAVQMAQAFNASAPSPISGSYLIHDKHGSPIKRNSFQAAWGKAMRAWVAKGNKHFTYHDLKAAGYSDQQDQFAGHKSEKMHKVYSRKLRIVQPPS